MKRRLLLLVGIALFLIANSSFNQLWVYPRRICRNLVSANMLDASECNALPIHPYDYMPILFPEGVSVEYVRTGMLGYKLSQEHFRDVRETGFFESDAFRLTVGDSIGLLSYKAFSWPLAYRFGYFDFSFHNDQLTYARFVE